MQSLEIHLKEYLNIHRISKEDTICIGVSGGVDSMVLLHLFSLCHPKEKILVLHVNHLLRWEESNLDEALVKKTCSLYCIACETLRIPVKDIAQSTKSSLEMAGRAVRREFFEASRQKYNACGIFLAHHLWDQAETVLRNFIKGSRLRWLSGMRETDGVYFRPLLKIPKPQLKEWAIAHAIAWREDISNASQEFERNRIRNDIIPIARTLNPEVEQAIWEFAMFADRMHTFFEDFFKEILAAGSISVTDFERYPDVLQDSFIELLFAQAHGGGTIGLSGGNITEIKRFILTARGNTKKEVGQLRLLKRKNMIYWGD